MEVTDPTHSRRRETEALIEECFRAAFGARLDGHYRQIAAWRLADGSLRAAAGIRFAEEERLFLEQYLDEPIEQAVARRFKSPVARDDIVEIGALAADGPASALEFFNELATQLASQRGRRFAVATVRPELRRLLRRAGFDLRALASADPSRLAAGATSWGTYYDGGPQVCVGEIGVASALAHLCRRRRAREMDRQVRHVRMAGR
jgi:hypothetical protein